MNDSLSDLFGDNSRESSPFDLSCSLEETEEYFSEDYDVPTGTTSVVLAHPTRLSSGGPHHPSLVDYDITSTGTRSYSSHSDEW